MSEGNNNDKHWQEAIAPPLLARLQRPIGQPGIIDSRGMARRITSRTQRMANRLPLLAQVERRWSGISELPAGQTPIVYAQPRPPQSEEIAPVKASGSVQTPVVQAKLAPRKSPSQTSGMLAVNGAARKENGAALPEADSSPAVGVSSLPVTSNQDSSQIYIQRKLAPGMANSTSGVDAVPASTSRTETSTGRQGSLPVVAVGAKHSGRKMMTEDDKIRPRMLRPSQSEPYPGGREGSLPVVASQPAQEKQAIAPLGHRTAIKLPVPPVTLAPGQTKSDRPLVVRTKLTSSGGGGGADRVQILPGNMGQSTVNWTGVGMTPLVLPVPSGPREQKADAKTLQSGGVTRAHGSRQQKTPETTISKVVMPADTQAPTGDRKGKRPQTDDTSKIDLEALTDKVERKLVRRLRVEKERRGQGRWR